MIVTTDLFAPDEALPARDALLDADYVSAHLGSIVGLDGPVTFRTCERVRAKYRWGESLRVMYRVAIGGDVHLVSGRAHATAAAALDAADRAFNALGSASNGPGSGGLRPLRAVSYDAARRTVWWAYPYDPRLPMLPHLARPAAELRDSLRLPCAEWSSSELVEYAPERSATFRALDDAGAVLAYVKLYCEGAAAGHLANIYDAVSTALSAGGAPVRVPRALASNTDAGLLALQPMPGLRWDQVATDELAATMRRLGIALGHLHRIDPHDVPALPRFDRLLPRRLANSAAFVASVRPDVAELAGALAAGLDRQPPRRDEDDVILHGDVHPKNALADHASGLALIDIDQAGRGSTAVDLGSLLARVRYGALVGEHDAATGAILRASFLDGYGSVAPLPSRAALRWHCAAALLAERALRAVNRVHNAGLAVLPEILAAAVGCLEGDDDVV
jgi:Ser/Thr protein kinase RdoA (MazF antagonist)